MDTAHAPGRFRAPAPEPRWYATYTHGRHEKRVAALLEQRGIESFLPLRARHEQWSDRTRRVLWPLFPSYVFARFDLRDLARVLGVTGVVTVVKVGPTPVPIADDEIENIRLLTRAVDSHGLEPELEPYAVVGARVRVGAGPLAGVEGVVVQRRGRTRVLVGLEAVGQGISVEVESATLELLEETRPAKAG